MYISSAILWAVDLDAAFAQLKTAFPKTAGWQGTHFCFAERNGVWLIERKRIDRFYYWLLWEGQVKLIHASLRSKLAPMRTIGDSFSLPASLTPTPDIPR